MEPIQLIDAILNLVYENSGLRPLNSWQTLITFKKFDGDELRMIFEKLYKDGYVLRPNEGSYQISFEGKIFHQNGGYNNEFITAQLNYESISLKNSQDRINQKLLVRGAIGAACGAIGLVVWEVIKFCFLQHSK